MNISNRILNCLRSPCLHHIALCITFTNSGLWYIGILCSRTMRRRFVISFWPRTLRDISISTPITRMTVSINIRTAIIRSGRSSRVNKDGHPNGKAGIIIAAKRHRIASDVGRSVCFFYVYLSFTVCLFGGLHHLGAMLRRRGRSVFREISCVDRECNFKFSSNLSIRIDTQRVLMALLGRLMVNFQRRVFFRVNQRRPR